MLWVGRGLSGQRGGVERATGLEQLLLESTVQWRAPLLLAEVAVMVDMTAWLQ